ncbi:MAG: hypothetical protein ACI4IL_06145 [Eubacterium sp.]
MLKEIWKYAKLLIAMVLGNIIPMFIMFALSYELPGYIAIMYIGFIIVSITLAWIISKNQLSLAKSELIIYIPLCIVSLVEAVIFEEDTGFFVCSLTSIKSIWNYIYVDYNGTVDIYSVIAAFIYPVFQLLAILLFYYLFKLLDKHKKLKKTANTESNT